MNAKTGVPVPSFGKGGVVDLKLDDDQPMDLITGEIGLHAAPIIAKDVILVGAAHLPAACRSEEQREGLRPRLRRATGKRLWIFHTIPRPGEFGNDTWENDSWSYTGNAGVWAQMTVDEELGIAYLPVELPTGDYYGGHRPGAGLFGESLVALDLKTGKRKWHYQLVHHGIWDIDIPCAPILADITVNGRAIKAVAQPTKQGWLYVFDRVTGQPVWPIEERPVEKGNVPGEWYSPTQPFVTKPPAFDRQGVSDDDLIDFTPELRAEAVELVEKYKIGPLFTPPVDEQVAGPARDADAAGRDRRRELAGRLVRSRNPHLLHLLATPRSRRSAWCRRPNDVRTWTTSRDSAQSGCPGPGGSRRAALPAAGGGAAALARGAGPAAPAPRALRRRRRRRWRVADRAGPAADQAAVRPHHRARPEQGRDRLADRARRDARQHPQSSGAEGADHPADRPPGRIGTLVTKTLVIAGEGGFFTTPTGQRGAMLRAYDKATGKEVGAVYMPAPQTGSPMTYMLNGKQYITVVDRGGRATAAKWWRSGSARSEGAIAIVRCTDAVLFRHLSSRS